MHGDDGKLLDLHGGELRVARSQQRLCPVVVASGGQDLRPSVHHDPGEAPPVFFIAVEHDGHLRIVGDVAQPLQRPGTLPLRLLVDGYEEHIVGQAEADRNDMGDRAAVGGRQTADPLRVEEVTFARR